MFAVRSIKPVALNFYRRSSSVSIFQFLLGNFYTNQYFGRKFLEIPTGFVNQNFILKTLRIHFIALLLQLYTK